MKSQDFGELRSLFANTNTPITDTVNKVWRFLGKNKDPLYLKEVLVPYCLSAMRGAHGCFHIYEQGLFDPEDPRYLLMRHLFIQKRGILDLHVMRESPYLRNVVGVNARGYHPNYLGDDGLAQVLEVFPRLTFLHVERNRITAEGIKHLVSSRALRKITDLYLADNCIKDEGAYLLASCPDTVNLKHLSITLKYKGREAMLNSRHIPADIRLKIRSM